MTVEGVELLGRLPHRPPFLFVTRVVSLGAAAGEGVWVVTGGEWFLSGHFPNRPVVPGVLLVEALAQMAGLVAGSAKVGETVAPMSAAAGRLAMVNVRFHESATPPCDITLSARVERNLDKLWLFEVAAAMGAQRLAAGELALAVEPAGPRT